MTAPPSFLTREVSPTDVSAGFGPVLPHTVHVPPSWSLTTSTAFSLGARAGLLHPAPDPGVHRVSTRAVAFACGCPPASLGLVPPLRCSPFSAFPACAAEPTSPPSRAPSPLPTCLPTRPRGLAPHPRPWRRRRVSATPCPMRSWASRSWRPPPQRTLAGSVAGCLSSRTRWTPVFATRSLRHRVIRPALHTLAGAFRPDLTASAAWPCRVDVVALLARPASGLPRSP
jgi:hypothetical protein